MKQFLVYDPDDNDVVVMRNRLFGTDGVRGIVNETLTPDFILRLALAIGEYFPPGSRILVGNDARAGNEYIVKVVTGALIASGLKVYYAGALPTPALQFNVKERGFDGGVMVTASHNPPQYSGVKVIMADGVEAPRDVEERIEEAFFSGRYRRVPWHTFKDQYFKLSDSVEYYVEGVVKKVDSERIRRRGFRVVADCANNVGALTTPRILRRLGVKVLSVNAHLSPIPYREPEPVPENLTDTSEIVRAIGADFGVAHDGDADRAIFIDDTGRVIPGDRSAALLCRHIVVNRGDKAPRRVVTAVSSSTIIEDVLKDLGVEVYWTKVGSVGIARTMMKIGALAGFEENGGFMYPPHQYVRDGGMALALMLEYLSYEGRKLSEVINELPSVYLIKTKVPLSDRGKAVEIIEEIKRRYSNLRIIDIDGVKGIGEDFWFLVRPSGTEPVLRIFVECRSKDKAEKLLNDILSIVKEVVGG